MFKKGIIAAAILAASGSAFAGGPETPPPLTYNSGFYLGIGASRDDGYVDTVWQNTAINVANTVAADAFHRGDFGADGWDVHFLAGYDWRINESFDMGFELYGSLSTMRYTNSTFFFQDLSAVLPIASRNFNRTLRVKIPYTIGFGVLPGYHLAPGALLFGRIAYVNSRFKVLTSSFSNPTNGFDGTASNPINRNTNESGIELGFGQRVRVSDHISIRGEYDWSYYGTINANAFTPAGAAGGLITNDSFRTYRGKNPEIESLNVAIMYDFTPAGSGPDWTAQPLHTGMQYYGGLSLSRTTAKSDEDFYHDLNLVVPNQPPFLFSQIQQNADVKLRGWDGTLILGAGYALPTRYYLGVEGDIGVSSVDGAFRYSDFSFILPGAALGYRTRTDLDWFFGFSAMPGYYVTDDTLLYGRIGVVWGEFALKSTGTTTPNTVLAAVFNNNYHTTEAGIELGVGMDTAVTSNVSLRTEFDVVKYNGFRTRTVTSAPSAAVLGPQAPVSISRNIFVRPFADEAKVALIYHFFS